MSNIFYIRQLTTQRFLYCAWVGVFEGEESAYRLLFIESFRVSFHEKDVDPYEGSRRDRSAETHSRRLSVYIGRQTVKIAQAIISVYHLDLRDGSRG
jgi:hypothetical protein